MNNARHARVAGLWAVAVMGAGCASVDPAGLEELTWSNADYADLRLWAAHPDLPAANAVSGIPEDLVWGDGEDLGVDVFYVHPTQYYHGDTWNADWDNLQVNRDVDELPVALQASAFDIGGRLYAPRYRQAIYGVFSWKDSLSRVALDRATGDVAAAFYHYMKTWNGGRPFILAGHSQGSWHLRKLLQAIERTPLKERLVAVYAPGFDWYASDFDVVPPCDGPDQVGCWNSWMSYGEGYFPDWLDRVEGTPVCTNPVTWRRDEAVSTAAAHRGVVMRNGKCTLPNSIGCYAARGVLQIKPPDMPLGGLYHRDNWHVGDVNLFWPNIRENARHRAERWLARAENTENARNTSDAHHSNNAENSPMP